MILEIILITNMYRSLIGAPVLVQNDKLTTSAQNKACDMYENNYWAHVRPSDGQTPWEVILDAGYIYKYAGENLAQNFHEPQAAMTAWLASPKHRDNIEKKEYTEIGVAICGNIITVHFGKPK